MLGWLLLRRDSRAVMMGSTLDTIPMAETVEEVVEMAAAAADRYFKDNPSL